LCVCPDGWQNVNKLQITTGWIGKDATKGLCEDFDQWTRDDWAKALFQTGAWMYFNPLLGDDFLTMKPTGALFAMIAELSRGGKLVLRKSKACALGGSRYNQNRWGFATNSLLQGTGTPRSLYVTMGNLEGMCSVSECH
jgi:hypothetical protein